MTTPTQKIWYIFYYMHHQSLKEILEEAGLTTHNLSHRQMTRQAVVKWFGGFPPNFEELDKLTNNDNNNQ
jgi:hypothetical protein